MSGINRICITDTVGGRGAWRFVDSAKLYPVANQLYREIFSGLGMPLSSGEVITNCTKDEFYAGYDYSMGIDVILEYESGNTSTMQEKFLFTTFDTVTVEYMQDWRNETKGDWFNIKAQFYFIGYDYHKSGIFDNWILLDWLNVQMATAQGRIPWKLRNNLHDGAKSSFRYAKFTEFPESAIVAKR